MNHILVLGIALSTFCTSHSIKEFCNLPHEEGTGTSFHFATYYDPSKDLCYPFLYRGEGGNANRFDNERECMRNCSPNVDQFYPMDESMACHFNYSKGGCDGKSLRFYYDSVRDKCKKFFWTGCLGNGNRFLSQESCNATCAGIHDDGEGEEEEEPDTPVALICGIVFGVIGAIILIVVIVLLVQSKDSPKGAPKKTKEAQAQLPLQEVEVEIK
ncbi:BPTI/Kunitz domain-containing protein [Lampris incognitus]|uniref:BPTI/Kunitz domain-containing protein n=1 Tax=Lampris incognitus TaxID=2546036 RepID=UPI0024B5CEED|nr:BPTI/Kunitz domain-containing protein [Lampris incognitus]